MRQSPDSQTYRHANGSGLKVYPAQASADCWIDRDSTLEGKTDAYHSTVRDSALKDTFCSASQISHSLVAGSHVADGARVVNSEITSSHVVCAHVLDCRLRDCRVAGCLVSMEGVSLEGVTVSGDTVLTGPWGLSLTGAHIHAGEWRRAPRHVLIEGNGIHAAVVECTEGRAHLGCACRPIAYWIERGPGMARRFGWTQEQIETCLTFLHSLSAS